MPSHYEPIRDLRDCKAYRQSYRNEETDELKANDPRQGKHSIRVLDVLLPASDGHPNLSLGVRQHQKVKLEDFYIL